MTGTGRNSGRNGSVNRRVAIGLVTETRALSASNGFERLNSGSDPSASLSSPSGRRWRRPASGRRLGHAPAQPAPDEVRDLGVRAVPVDRVEHDIQQRRQLQDLPVPAPHQRRWGPVAGPHHLADELDPVDAGGGVDQCGHGVVSTPATVASSVVDASVVAGASRWAPPASARRPWAPR